MSEIQIVKQGIEKLEVSAFLVTQAAFKILPTCARIRVKASRNLLLILSFCPRAFASLDNATYSILNLYAHSLFC